jgi:putative hydroxymethylpyrimidine transport system substrate-binding protein
MRVWTRFISAALITLAVAGCGAQKDVLTPAPGSAQRVTLMLDWFPNADHVGLYQALAEGDFKRADLNVNVQVPSDPASPLELLAAGKVDFAISYEPELMLARDQNQPLVSVAAIVQKPLTSIVSIGSKHIRTPAQLRGKHVGDAGIAYQRAYLTTILARAGVPESSVTEVNVGSNLVPAMLSGRVDATLGAYWNVEAIELARLHKHPNVIQMDQVGVPTYNELVLVVRNSELTSHIDVVRRFVQALARGYQSARRDPVAAVGNLARASPGTDKALTLAEVEATMPAFFPPAGKPWGYQNQTDWNLYGQWMLSHHLVHDPNAVIDASTNEVLAGQGS